MEDAPEEGWEEDNEELWTIYEINQRFDMKKNWIKQRKKKKIKDKAWLLMRKNKLQI